MTIMYKSYIYNWPFCGFVLLLYVSTRNHGKTTKKKGTITKSFSLTLMEQKIGERPFYFSGFSVLFCDSGLLLFLFFFFHCADFCFCEQSRLELFEICLKTRRITKIDNLEN